MTAVAEPPVAHDPAAVAACERRVHYSAEHLAANAARMIALSHGDPEPMLPAVCEVCGEWRITGEGTGVRNDERPHRGTRKARARKVREQRAADRKAAESYWQQPRA